MLFCTAVPSGRSADSMPLRMTSQPGEVDMARTGVWPGSDSLNTPSTALEARERDIGLSSCLEGQVQLPMQPAEEKFVLRSASSLQQAGKGEGAARDVVKQRQRCRIPVCESGVMAEVKKYD